MPEAKDSDNKGHSFFPGRAKHSANHRESHSKLHNNKVVKADRGFVRHEPDRDDVEPEDKGRGQQGQFLEHAHEFNRPASEGFKYRRLSLLQHGIGVSEEVQIKGQHDRFRMISFIYEIMLL